jgi:Fe-S-cluster containining protein
LCGDATNLQAGYDGIVVELTPQQQSEFGVAVARAAGREDVRQAIASLYAALQDAIDLRRPLCTTSGRCCRFDEFGHRLFVTTLEMAAFIGQMPDPGMDNPGGCPFQREKLCSVHTIRPFGCRVFFCDATATDWQQEQYARFHQELRRLHEELNVPYFYVEWRQGLGVALKDWL